MHLRSINCFVDVRIHDSHENSRSLTPCTREAGIKQSIAESHLKGQQYTVESSKFVDEIFYDTLQPWQYNLCPEKPVVSFYYLNHDLPTSHIGDTDHCGKFNLVNIWKLPHADFEGQWESLHHSDSVKSKLMNMALLSIEFQLAGFDLDAVQVGKIVHLYGPPGTGKTSLIQALAQKLSIRASRDKMDFYLIRINQEMLSSSYIGETSEKIRMVFNGIRTICSRKQRVNTGILTRSRRKKAKLNFDEDPERSKFLIIVMEEVDGLLYNRRVTEVHRVDCVALMTYIPGAKCKNSSFIDRVDMIVKTEKPDATLRRKVLLDGIGNLFRDNYAFPSMSSEIETCVSISSNLSTRKLKSALAMAFFDSEERTYSNEWSIKFGERLLRATRYLASPDFTDSMDYEP
ncbi:hypothetical protein ACOME3_002109 [Neoechinorhynchus agilis]